MVGLIDIAPASILVAVNGSEVEVHGISASGLASLMQRFPEIRALLSGGEIDLKDVYEFGPKAVAAIIAAGCGSPGDKKAEEIASKLNVESQIDLIEAILKATLPGGVKQIMGKIEAISGTLGGGALSGTGPAMN